MTTYQFDYQIKKDQRIFISWQGRHVMILKGKKANQLAQKLESASKDEAELILAKITGNFKRGNEKDNK